MIGPPFRALSLPAPFGGVNCAGLGDVPVRMMLRRFARTHCDGRTNIYFTVDGVEAGPGGTVFVSVRLRASAPNPYASAARTFVATSVPKTEVE